MNNKIKQIKYIVPQTWLLKGHYKRRKLGISLEFWYTSEISS